jgi:hypothetical protein
MTADTQTLEQSFRELRSWIDDRLAAKGLPQRLSRLPQTRGEASAVTGADIGQLKADIAELIRLEGRRSFWSGFAVNGLFFVLGLGAGAMIDAVKAGGWWPF